MKSLRALALGMAILVAVSGCGTINDISKGDGGQRIYGGVRQDASMISDSGSETAMVLGIIDFPFSLALDTALLPITLIFAIFRGRG